MELDEPFVVSDLVQLLALQEYERSYWKRVRIAAPELLGFLAHALEQVDTEHS